jgi:hypothetical protein
MSKKTVPTKEEGFTRLWGVRFRPEEATLIEDEARAKNVKPGTYIRMAAMESARIHQRTRGEAR